LGFSPDIVNANEALWRPDATSESMAATFNGWLRQNQPCVFGRIAALSNRISYCFLTEADLSQSDDAIHGKIQAARLDWTRQAFDGNKSAFLVVAVSKAIGCAEPNPELLNFAINLASLYLETDIAPDRIYLEEVFLERPGSKRITWKWDAGVNVFATSADRRWWADHRIPGGLALSVNSVGHMVKATRLAVAIKSMDELTGTTEDTLEPTRVDSPGQALAYAMQTIDNAAKTEWGPATSLIDYPKDQSGLPRCPIVIKSSLSSRNHCEYSGRYHTDVTVPSEYFDPRTSPPADLTTHRLDFTYLFHRDVSNPDHVSMGEGKRIRDSEVEIEPLPWDEREARVGRVEPIDERIDNWPRLVTALEQ
jgi:hypothetical protein